MLGKFLFKLYDITLRTFFLIVIALFAVAFILTVTDFSKYERYLIPLQLLKADPKKISKGLWVGPYMDPEDLYAFLKENRIKSVVILLDWDMIHERRLTEKEVSFLEKKGIRVYLLPMKPFLEKPEDIRKLKFLVKKLKKRGVYVHSYLGRVRVKVLER